jgi:hypothetical protein
VSAVRPFKRKSRVHRLLDSVVDTLGVPDGVKSGVPSKKPLTAGLIAAGSLAGLTAASAHISALRRHGTGRG